jgi:leucyl-tRNA synthetase
MGPVTASAPWNPRDLPGVHRFLQRAWRVFDAGFAEDACGDIERGLHKCIKKVGDDIESMGYNTAIAAMMEFINLSTKSKSNLTVEQGRRFSVLLEPFAPHIAEELYKLSSGDEPLSHVAWPSYDEKMLVADTIEIPVQINGKLRAKAVIAADANKDVQQAAAEAAIAGELDGNVIKVIVIPGRMVNFVVS